MVAVCPSNTSRMSLRFNVLFGEQYADHMFIIRFWILMMTPLASNVEGASVGSFACSIIVLTIIAVPSPCFVRRSLRLTF